MIKLLPCKHKYSPCVSPELPPQDGLPTLIITEIFLNSFLDNEFPITCKALSSEYIFNPNCLKSSFCTDNVSSFALNALRTVLCGVLTISNFGRASTVTSGCDEKLSFINGYQRVPDRSAGIVNHTRGVKPFPIINGMAPPIETNALTPSSELEPIRSLANGSYCDGSSNSVTLTPCYLLNEHDEACY